MLQTWTTDDVPRADRFAYWREVRARNLFGVAAELAPDRRAAFRGAFSLRAVGGATIAEVHASPYEVRRFAAEIARAPSDSLCLYQQLDGASWFDDRRGDEFVITAGGLATSWSDMPYATTPTTDEGYHFRVVKIPLAACPPLVLPGDMAPRPVVVAPGIARLLASYLVAFLDEAPHLAGAAADTAVETLARLALAARGAAGATDERGIAAVRAGRLEAARRLIDREFHHPTLSADTIAARLGISVRQLHLLFEPTGLSVSRSLTARRVAAARRMLAEASSPPVAEVAFACGFDSLATFHRAIRAACGATPGELRRGGAPAG